MHRVIEPVIPLRTKAQNALASGVGGLYESELPLSISESDETESKRLEASSVPGTEYWLP